MRELIAILIILAALALLHPRVQAWLEAIDMKADLGELPGDES